MAYEPTLEDFESYEPSLSDFEELGANQAPQEGGGILSSLASGAKSVGSSVGRFGTGVLQGASEVGQGIGDLETRLINAMLGTKMQSPKSDIFGAIGVEPGIAGKVGELGGELLGTGALGGAASALAKGAEAPALLSKLGGKPAEAIFSQLTSAPGVFGATVAATKPGEALERIKAGGAAYVGGKALEKGGQLLNYINKNVSTKKMGKLLEKYNAASKAESKELYNKAFQGTGEVRPTISASTANQLGSVFSESGTAKIKNMITKFNEKPSLKKLHNIRKDVQGKIRSLESSKEKSVLGGEDSDLLFNLNKLSDSITGDLEKSFKKIGGDKFEQWKQAQSHFKEKRLPLRKYKSVRDYLSKEKTISPALKRDLLKDENTAKFLAKELGISRGVAKALEGKKFAPVAKNIALYEAFKGLIGG